MSGPICKYCGKPVFDYSHALCGIGDPVPLKGLASFTTVEAELVGAFVGAFARAFRRPFLRGPAKPKRKRRRFPTPEGNP